MNRIIRKIIDSIPTENISIIEMNFLNYNLLILNSVKETRDLIDFNTGSSVIEGFIATIHGIPVKINKFMSDKYIILGNNKKFCIRCESVVNGFCGSKTCIAEGVHEI